MKFILFVEGYTEESALPNFLKRWLDPKLSQKVGVQTVRFDGWAELVKDVENKANRYLNGPTKADIIGVVALLDLYGPTFYPANMTTAKEKFEWAKENIEERVGHPKFRQHFAVHDCEAWLLCSPNAFPEEVRKVVGTKSAQPEQVNFDEPPKKFLERVYWEKAKTKYRAVTHGYNLFADLDPDLTYQRCPCFRIMLDEMLTLAEQAGLKKHPVP